jgi:hypothetical protein
MKNDKSPGANGVTAEAFKAMNPTNLQEVYHLIKAFWDGARDFAEQVAPSKQDTSPKDLKPRRPKQIPNSIPHGCLLKNLQ